jgi:hypothetical protein
MAKMIALDPAPKQALCDGWDLIAMQAGRYAKGTQAVLHVYNGTVQMTRTLVLAQAKSWTTFLQDLGGLTQQPAEDLEKSLLLLADAVELALRRQERHDTAPAELLAVELMAKAPDVLSRPLMLINGRAYASTWLWTKTTFSKDGQEFVTQQRQHFVIKDGGRLFGYGGDHPLDELGIDIGPLDGSHPEALLWSMQGVSDYHDVPRGDVAQTFREVVTLFDYFMDFRGSLAPQKDMCELSACLSLMTWFADAFTILPYPWATSPGPGSGKSKWGLCWVMTSYLGYATTMGGTFAALRDLAEMGATLLFDDAELLSNLGAVDPDKRELVLAGNRKGVTIPVKEPDPGGGWRLRWMNAYCPRGFTAIRLPSGPLETRCIVLPFLKTADPLRGNRDPANEKTWPIPRRQLTDHLWMLATSLLPEAERLWHEIGDEQELIGRSFEPWKAVLTVARLMERHGAEKLETRMRTVMNAYQSEKQEFIAADRITFLLRGLLNLMWLTRDKRDDDDVRDIVTLLGERPNDFFSFSTSDLLTQVLDLAERMDVTLALGESPNRTIGQTLKKLRFTKDDSRTSRGWQITKAANVVNVTRVSDVPRLWG